MKKFKKVACMLSACALVAAASFPLFGCSSTSDVITLRVCNWEEYIDLGDWGEDELIGIENPYAENPEDGIFGENSLVDDFVEWFNANHDYEVNVEYSTFGTNEDLYNRLSLGDKYDLVCPSDYMIMKLLNENQIQPYSDEFFDATNEENYYVNNVSPYITGIFDMYGDENGTWNKYAACYMWGTTGLVYNPDKIADVSDVQTWNILRNSDYSKQVTIKDNVRDAYFVTLGMINRDELLSLGTSAEDAARRSDILNDTADQTIADAEDVLKDIKENVYSFETDSGKADMVTGKVIANYQWSGDAVYIMDEAEGDELNPTELWYSVPDECTNLWFDGWVMLKNGIEGNSQRQEAAEAFVNFISRPDNAVRNMYYIGYTSSIADQTVYNYMKWTYGFVFDPSDEEYFDEELVDVYEYDLGYFFGDGYDPLYVDASMFEIDTDNLAPSIEKLGEKYGNDIEYNVYSGASIDRGRQLFAQYPSANVIDRSVVMLDFGDKLSDINQMWINVRCLDLLDIPPLTVGIVVAVVAVIAIIILLYVFRYRIFIKHRHKKGYELVK